MKYSVLALGVLLSWVAQAQNIERVKLTDGELSCRQIHDELGHMDTAIAQAQETRSKSEVTTTAGQAGSVAAEVASRTGLFGQMGGLFGHVAGTIAAKTAAGATEQSGRDGVQQAAEREKQALARKEHLSTIFLARGCSASNLDAPPTNAGPLPMATAAPAKVLSTEEVLREYGANLTPASGEVALDRNNVGVATAKRVLVPGYRVAFVVKTSASAYGGGALANLGNTTGGSRTITQAQNRRVEMALAGVDLGLLQGLTDRLHADFVARLQSTGRDVIALDTLSQTAGFEKLKTVKELPYKVSPSMQGDPRDYVMLTPKGLPLFFMHIDSYLGNAGPFEQESTKAIHELAARLDAVAFIPTLQIDIAELESSGRSSLRAGAEADVIPKLGVGARSELRFLTGKDAKIFFTGDFGTLTVKKPLFVDAPFGEVKTVSSFDTASLANSLTAATGLQGAQHFVDKRELRVDPSRFANGVLKAGAAFNQAVITALQ